MPTILDHAQPGEANNQRGLLADDLFYEDLIRSYVDAPGFVERPWLARRVDEALADPGCRFVLLTAEPGAGKTTLMAWLADQNPGWPRYFIRRDSKTPLSSGDARSFLFAIGHQLAARRPALFRPENLEVVVQQEIADLKASGRAAGIQIEDLQVSPFYHTALRVEQHVQIAAGELVGISIKHLTLQPRLQETGNLQYLALIDPARVFLAENAAGRIIILVNALDELRYLPGGESILDWLTGCPELPGNVRLVLTSRPDPALLDGFRQSQTRWLRELSVHPENPRVQDDLRRCAHRLASQAKVGGALAKAGMPAQVFTKKAVGVARGNFQCLVTLFRNLEQAVEHGSQAEIQRAVALEELPKGLEDLYAFYIRQVRRSVVEMSVETRGAEALEVKYLPAWEGLYQPLLGLLCVTQEPQDQSWLRSLGLPGVEQRWVTGALGRLGQFLQPRVDGFRLYHTTLVDFLTASQTAATYPDCYLDPHEWHRRITAHYLANFKMNWSKCDHYGLTYLVDHIVKAGLADHERAKVLDQVLTDKFINVVLKRNGWLFSVVKDLEVLAKEEPGRATQRCLSLILDWKPPNSLVTQHCLRLLVKLRGVTGSVADTGDPRQMAVDKLVESLSRSRSEAPDLLCGMLVNEREARVRGVIALALAETGDASVTPRLVEMLRKERGEASWGAADGLIALNDRSVIPELVGWYQAVQSKNDIQHAADKWRILYILGWMHAEQGQTLKQDAWNSCWPRIVGRGIDLTWLLPPAEGDTAFLPERLNHLVSSLPESGPWADEWVQKRLVRALMRLNVTAAVPDLQRLRERLRQATGKSAKRERLSKTVRDAIEALEANIVGS